MVSGAGSFTIQRNAAGMLALASLLLASGAGCSRRDVQTATAGAPAPTRSAAPTSISLPFSDGGRPLMYPIHEGVQVNVGASEAGVAYTRARGKAFGAAYMLTPGVLADRAAIELRIRTRPALRPQVCLTDGAGNVWNVPAAAGTTGDHMRFDLLRVQADPFQNNGRTLPASPDLGSIKMLTILDISGFMGGAEAPCEWVLEDLTLTPRDDASSAARQEGSGR